MYNKIIKNKAQYIIRLSKYIGTIVYTDLQFVGGVFIIGVFKKLTFTSWYVYFQILNSYTKTYDNYYTMCI